MENEFYCVFTERQGVPSLFDCIKPPCYMAATAGGDEWVRRRAEPDEEGGAATSAGNNARLSKPKK